MLLSRAFAAAAAATRAANLTGLGRRRLLLVECAAGRRRCLGTSASSWSFQVDTTAGAAVAPQVAATAPHGIYFAAPDGLVNEKISAGLDPSLAELGLDGFWPPDLVQRALEWLHCSCDLPWWASITALVVTARVLLFPVLVIHRRNCNLYMNAIQEQQATTQKLMLAVMEGRTEEADWLQKRLTDDMRHRTMPMLLRFMACPVLAFAPVFGSTFYALNRLSHSGLPSLETGGALWFLDLTVPDPYLGLPLFSIATTYAMLLTGTEMPQLSKLPGSKFTRGLLFGLPLVALPLALHFSAAVVYFWSLNNVLSLAQGVVLKRPEVAKAFGIPEVKPFTPPSGAPSNIAEFQEMFKARRDAGLPKEMEERIRKLREQRTEPVDRQQRQKPQA